MKNYFNKQDEKLKWTEGEKKTLLKTIVGDVTSRHNTSYTGVTGDYIIFDTPDWVIVIPEKDDKFLMVKQWRHGSDCLSIEFPGGVVDKGEDADAAAARELEEETGCKAGNLIKLGSVNPNPALFCNKVHVYLAKDLCSTGSQHLDNDEFVNYFEMDKDEVIDAMGSEQFPHAIMGTALMYYLQYCRKQK